MIDGLRVLAVIPARGGSRGIPRKNIADVAGRPLLAWTVDAAREARVIDEVICSTDSEAIARLARDSGCTVPWLRPAELAADDTPGIAVARHAAENMPGFDLLCYLQPTSPLRTGADIDAAVTVSANHGGEPAVSVCAAEHPPAWMGRIEGDGHLTFPLGDISSARQQDADWFRLNGAVYVPASKWLLGGGEFLAAETRAVEMPASRSLDIDTPEQLEWFAWLASRPEPASR